MKVRSYADVKPRERGPPTTLKVCGIADCDFDAQRRSWISRTKS